ncbi:MAG: YafY family transcriptional regulator [Betaproteobacteria bacterium]|nr:YafY family transcriptional regulator [Betaproteobacteria bacterium]
MRRADRLFQIVLLLGRRRAITARELAEALRVSERTIYRDIADLSLSGVPVEGAAGVGYLMRGGYQLPPLMFDPEELAALALGSRMVQGWADPELGRAAERALLKIEAVLPPALQDRPEVLLAPDFHVPAAMVAPLGLLRRAIGESRKTAFAYTRADGQASHRTVWPLGLFFWGETWTLGAWCELRSEYRSFRLDRMTGLTLQEDRFISGGLLEDFIRVVSACAASG